MGTTAKGYELAKEAYAAYGVDTDKAMEMMDQVPISIQCWQGDDVLGFLNPPAEPDAGGIQTTGNYPGRARNADELRSDLDLAISFIPGSKRVNVHAIYLECDKRVERDAIEPSHFQNWVDWARAEQPRSRLQPDLLLSPQERSEPHPQ